MVFAGGDLRLSNLRNGFGDDGMRSIVAPRNW